MSGLRTAVIMAGGQGSRLRPLTYAIPKPLLPVGKRPIAEIIIGQLRDAGCRTVYLSVGYRAELLRAYFQTGAALGVEIRYLEEREDEPLGTAGALALLNGAVQEPMLVINGDILTTQDLGAFFDEHVATGAALTIGTRQHTIEVPYGVLEIQDGAVTAVREKPRLEMAINAGIYVLSPPATALVSPGQRLDMTDLAKRCLDENLSVRSIPVAGPWFDIAKAEDLAEALRQLPDLA